MNRPPSGAKCKHLFPNPVWFGQLDAAGLSRRTRREQERSRRFLREIVRNPPVHAVCSSIANLAT